MSTTRRTVPGSGSKGSAAATNLPILELPSLAGEENKNVAGAKRAIVRLPDYDDEKVKERWKMIIDRQRQELETDVLQIMKPRAKLDQIANNALDLLCSQLIKKHVQADNDAAKSVKPEDLQKQIIQTVQNLEKRVRDFIVEKGIASEMKKVTQRLNARRMTDGRRWVLSASYVWLLSKLFFNLVVQHKELVVRDKAPKIEELVGDDLGVAEKVMLDLEAEKGPLDVFAYLLVKSVMERNRITKSKMLRELVAQQVRGAI